MMRVAVMSDIHGFDLALRTVIADLVRWEPLDQIVVAGDLCEVGPAPASVLAILWEKASDPRWTVLKGNTDRDIAEGSREGMDFVVDQIGQEGVAYLASLPFSHRITPPGGRSPDDDLLIVHANPHNLDDRLDPRWSDAELMEVIGGVRAKAIAFGHIHICYVREVNGILLVDVSAVGNPKDGDLRCAYGIIEWDADAKAWRAAIHRLEYPIEETEDQILSSELPRPEKVIKKLKKASY
jgi:predicted phosphodiesterase